MNKFKNEVEEYGADFDGVFRFTNNDDEDFVTLWNNKEYIYPAGKTVPMIIANESLENIQQIRKYFAQRLAEKRYYKTKNFKEIRNGIKDKDMGRNVLPSSYDEKALQPFIDDCLKPLPEGKAKVVNLPAEELITKASKPIGKGSVDGNVFPATDLNETFKESNESMLPHKN